MEKEWNCKCDMLVLVMSVLYKYFCGSQLSGSVYRIKITLATVLFYLECTISCK